MSNERSRDFGGAQTQGSDQGERRDPGADALLELARLIGGQNDPFAPEAPKSESRLSESRSETRLSETRLSETRLGDVSRAAAASSADAGRAPFSRTQDRPYEERSFERATPSRREPDFSEPGVEPSRMARASAGFDFPEPPQRGDYSVAPRHAAVDERDYDDGHAGSRGIPAYRRRRDEQAYEYADGDGDHGSDEHEDFDDGDEPGARRRRPTKAIMAVLGLAVFGSAAAYGYRTMISAAPSGPAIIHADTSPTKITPMSDVKTGGSGRIGDRIGEQLASRQEEPVDLGSSLRSAGASTTDVAPTAAPGDPRRVHTVPIRADQGTASSPDRPAPASRAAAAPPALAQPAAAPPAPRQAAAAPPSLAPSPPLQRQAAVAPASAPADTPAAAPVEGSGFVVQLLAVRSEEAAQTEYRRFQTKYSSVLSGRQPLIRRKDRGEQGTFFVAQVGPFGAKSDADQLCDALKSAGGGCYVYKY